MGGYYFDEAGEIHPTGVFVVYGAPASGKTTYVKQHKKPGELVIDLDFIKHAISFEWKTEVQKNLLNIALAMRECAYNLVERREIECQNVWVVAGLPRREERMSLMERLNAEMIFICTSRDECIQRALQDDERLDKEKQLAIINKYFDKFEP